MTNNIAYLVEVCVAWAGKHGLCGRLDIPYVRNRLLDILHLDTPYDATVSAQEIPESIVDTFAAITAYAVTNGLIDNTVTQKEIFDNRLGDALIAPPSVIAEKFYDIYNRLSPKQATQWFFNLCKGCNYIRTGDIARNKCYTAPSPYGDIEVTINLTKPEKDPAEIAAVAAAPQTAYPKCQLCLENMGFAGTLRHPARRSLRVIPITLNNEQWYFQYSPYAYFNEHCIAFSAQHTPMEINEATLRRLFDFKDILPHYFIGSNAGLPIAGGSILSHLHFQGGNHVLPMMKAEVKRCYYRNSAISVGYLNWPMPALRISGQDREAIIKAGAKIINTWEQYSDAQCGIYAQTDGEKHNTVTPILHGNGTYNLDLVLRNNLTSDSLPMGIFHPHPERHHIKRENIGLIEVMGLFILPGRLDKSLTAVCNYLCGNAFDDALLSPHRQWVDTCIKPAYDTHGYDKAVLAVKSELAVLCMQLLDDASVYKDDDAGHSGLDRFISAIDFDR